MSAALLSLENINTFYGPVQAHFDLNITVGRGQIVSLLGGNASGKSTTMKVILGLVKPRTGTVTIWIETILRASMSDDGSNSQYPQAGRRRLILTPPVGWRGTDAPDTEGEILRQLAPGTKLSQLRL